MPFTLSHAAAVLPLMRRTGTARGPLFASALIAGSFAPDLTYYADTVVPGAMLFGDVTHAPVGVVTVDVLVTALLVGAWLLVREPLVALLPRSWQGPAHAVARGRRHRIRGAGELAVAAGWFVLSAVIGATSHVVWDAFTHPGRWGTRLVPGLDQVVGGFPLSTYLQYGTSAPALLALGWFLWTALRDAGARGTGTPGTGAARRGGQGRDGAARAGAGRGKGIGTGKGIETGTGTGAGTGTWTGGAPAAVPVLTVRDRVAAAALLAVCVLAGVVHRTLRAHAVYGDTATWFDYVPTVLFGAGAGLLLGLPLYAVAVRLVRRGSRTGPDRPAPVRPAGRADMAEQTSER